MLMHASIPKKKGIPVHCLESMYSFPPNVSCQSIFILSIYTSIYNIYTKYIFLLLSHKFEEYLIKQGCCNADVT